MFGQNRNQCSGEAEIGVRLALYWVFERNRNTQERGLNEHTNGLIRQYLPKSTDFSQLTDSQIQRIENRLNHRPRKVLQYKTPFEVFYAGTAAIQAVALRC